MVLNDMAVGNHAPNPASFPLEGAQASLEVVSNINTVSTISSHESFPPTEFITSLVRSHIMARLRHKFTEIGWLCGIVSGPHLFPLWSVSGTCSKASFSTTTMTMTTTKQWYDLYQQPRFHVPHGKGEKALEHLVHDRNKTETQPSFRKTSTQDPKRLASITLPGRQRLMQRNDLAMWLQEDVAKHTRLNGLIKQTGELNCQLSAVDKPTREKFLKLPHIG